MRFAVFDHNDSTGRPPTTQLAERLALIEAYERLGYYAYQMAEHHGTPLGIATPHLMLAAALQRTSTIRLGTLISHDTYEEIAATGHVYAGDPAGARAWVAQHVETAGVSYVSLEFCFGDMTAAEARRSAELFATEVIPALT